MYMYTNFHHFLQNKKNTFFQKYDTAVDSLLQNII